MNRGAKREILEIRRAEREERLTAIRARIESRRADREQKLIALHDRIEARKAERDHRRTTEPAMKAEPNPELQAMKTAMMAGVPTIQFPEDDPKYHATRKYDRE